MRRRRRRFTRKPKTNSGYVITLLIMGVILLGIILVGDDLADKMSSVFTATTEEPSDEQELPPTLGEGEGDDGGEEVEGAVEDDEMERADELPETAGALVREGIRDSVTHARKAVSRASEVDN